MNSGLGRSIEDMVQLRARLLQRKDVQVAVRATQAEVEAGSTGTYGMTLHTWPCLSDYLMICICVCVFVLACVILFYLLCMC